MRKEILLIRCGDIECLNYRFPTSSLTEEDSLLHLPKIERRDKNCECPYCKRGCFEAVIPDCHTELDNSEMFMPQLEFPTPSNSGCRKCVDASDISPNIFLRMSSTETILNDLEVIDVIVCEKPIRGWILKKFKDSGLQVQVYK